MVVLGAEPPGATVRSRPTSHSGVMGCAETAPAWRPSERVGRIWLLSGGDLGIWCRNGDTVLSMAEAAAVGH